VVVENSRGTQEIPTRQVYSTIPVTLLTRLVDVPVPAAVTAAAGALGFRSMVLVYLLLDQDRFTEFDAHYFPGEEFTFTRLSETRNYTDRDAPAGRTVLCAEVPCFQDDDIWNMTDQALADVVRDGLARAGLPITSKVLEVSTKRIPFAYPLFSIGYEQEFAKIDQWMDGLEGVLSFGRQGLYVHDNTHHAIYMAQAAAACLRSDGTIDAAAWHAHRKVFESHVVED
jgi:protoporphyrinogen oxidase